MVSKTKQELVIHWHERGYEPKVIAKLLTLPIQAVEDIINGKPIPASTGHGPEFIEPPLF